MRGMWSRDGPAGQPDLAAVTRAPAQIRLCWRIPFAHVEMDEAYTSLTRFALDPKNRDVLSVVKGARNGLVYGSKIRFPHALVMVFLFGSGTPSEKFRKILTATRQHAVRLGSFVAIYKSLVLAQRKWLHGGKSDSLDTFIAGLVGGWYMFGERTPVNEQVRRAEFLCALTTDRAVLCGTLPRVAAASRASP